MRPARTYDQAEVALTRLQAQVDEDRHPKSGITVGQAVSQWLEVVELEDTTRERYQDLIRIYIIPTFGDLAAAKLDAELLERFYARLQRCRRSAMAERRVRATSVGRLAAAQSGRSTSFIRGSLERAVRWRHLGVNKAAHRRGTVAGAERARSAICRGGSAHAQRSLG